MRRGRFARTRGPLIAVTCIAAIVQLVGCKTHVTASSRQTSALFTDPLDAQFPPADLSAWKDSAPAGLQFTTCPLTSEETKGVLLSFLYHVAKTGDEIEPVSQKQFSIVACYRAEFRRTSGGGTSRSDVVVAIVADDYKHSDDVVDVVLHHLAYFANQSKLFEMSYAGSYGATYGIAAIPAAGENNPLVLVRRNEGGNSREIIYELYRVERERLRPLWQWEDHYSYSTSMAYSISNLDFSGITSSDHKRFTVYTTYGELRQLEPDTDVTPKHRVTSFLWNATAEAFVEERKTEQ